MADYFKLCLLPLLCCSLEVLIAQSRSSTRHRDVEDEELTRIFVTIPKSFTEEDLKETFKVFAPAAPSISPPVQIFLGFFKMARVSSGIWRYRVLRNTQKQDHGGK